MAWFDGWDIHAAHEDALIPWESPHRADAPNNVWLRRNRASPWALDLTVGEGTDTEWVYRRDSEVRRPWRDAICRSDSGIPYLAPELQLLFKSKEPRAKDHADAERVIPGLRRKERAFLDLHLPPGHPWQSLLRTN